MSPERIKAQFGRNLAEARGWAGLTQAELAEQTSVRRIEIGRYETGMRCPPLDRVVRLAEVLGLQVRDLLFEIE
ncbi:MAG TPA: helix-turn-helix transcriptional regulator [Solirubrobacterales bacterium]|nr:helix-turn-helix transcriptional regulator [Solirubrobacterales bacterium]